MHHKWSCAKTDICRSPVGAALPRVRAAHGPRDEHHRLLDDQAERGQGLHHLQLVVGRAHRHRRHPTRRTRRLQPQDLPEAASLRPPGIQVKANEKKQMGSVLLYLRQQCLICLLARIYTYSFVNAGVDFRVLQDENPSWKPTFHGESSDLESHIAKEVTFPRKLSFLSFHNRRNIWLR